ncbi:MAG TPA: transcription elongation factor subunit Spt4 [Candidatus Nanoarchaeia archaeon]|nr:transcription elongation factor subunit Spt4 [Candidatus Nanoarchaeia archaeon]
MAKKACRKCKIMVEGNQCPMCKGTDFTDNWKGRLYIIDASKSDIAKKVNITQKGEYAIKV